MSCWRLVVPDLVAVNILERDKCVRVVQKRQELLGYELYLVEQWACSRSESTIMIATLTGQTQHKIFVTVLEICPTESCQSMHVDKYMRSMSHHHARQQDTRLGLIMVTNLSTFPSALTILPISGDDIDRQKTNFVLSENLKRLGCSGRAGISLLEPTDASLARFHELYKLSERVPSKIAVLNLIQSCQIALLMFMKLKPESCDGLLCDLTCSGLSDWWTEIGSQYYNVEPGDGILGPTTVSALLGLFIGAKNRLHACGAPVPKDAFDVVTFKRGIAHFQRAQKFRQTRRLDHATLRKIHKITAKAVKNEGWTVPRAVKSTVAELGKGGEMVMGMVGAREKVGIADVETTDIEIFLKNVSGEHCKWLWRGKSRKAASSKSTFMTSEPWNVTLDDWQGMLNQSSTSEDDFENNQRQAKSTMNQTCATDSRHSFVAENEDSQGSVVTKNRSLCDDNRLDKFTGTSTGHNTEESFLRRRPETCAVIDASPGKLVGMPEQRNILQLPYDSFLESTHEKIASYYQRSTRHPSHRHHLRMKYPQTADVNFSSHVHQSKISGNYKKAVLGGTLTNATDSANTLEVATPSERHGLIKSMKRSKSNTFLQEDVKLVLDTSLDILNNIDSSIKPVPRCTRPYPFDINEVQSQEALLYMEEHQKCQRQNVGVLIDSAEVSLAKFCERRKATVIAMRYEVKEVSKHINSLLTRRSEQTVSEDKTTKDILRDTKEILTERTREIEALGARLEYEFGVLKSKIEDVEDGVAELDRQVSELEYRERVLDADSKDHTWQHWIDTLIRRIGLV